MAVVRLDDLGNSRCKVARIKCSTAVLRGDSQWGPLSYYSQGVHSRDAVSKGRYFAVDEFSCTYSSGVLIAGRISRFFDGCGLRLGGINIINGKDGPRSDCTCRFFVPDVS